MLKWLGIDEPVPKRPKVVFDAIPSDVSRETHVDDQPENMTAIFTVCCVVYQLTN